MHDFHARAHIKNTYTLIHAKTLTQTHAHPQTHRHAHLHAPEKKMGI